MLAVVVVLCIGIGGAWIALRPKPVPMSARFRTQAVTTGDVYSDVRATGHVEALTTVQVGAEISGRVSSVDVDFNDRVKEGQVLARFDRASLAAQLSQNEATLAAARAAFEQAKTDKERVGRDLARVQKLYEQKAISEADFDNASSASRLADQRVSAAEAQVAAQQALLSVARTNLDHGVIRAPIAGVIITRNIDPGQTVASMLQTPVLFTVAADLRKMKVIAAVDEADIGLVAPKQHAYFTVNAYQDRVFEGIVTEVRNSPVVVQDVVTYGTEIEVDNLDLALKPGMTASVRVRTAQAKDALRVPSAALRFNPPINERGEKAPPNPTPGVWQLDGQTLRRVNVQPGVTDGELTQIAPGAIAQGASVLVDLSPEGRKAYGLAH